MPNRHRLAIVIAWAVLTSVPISVVRAQAGGEPLKDPRAMRLLRFEYDNDTLLGSDDAFSAGWSLQVHSPLEDIWRPAYAGWIGRVPGLGDGGRGGRVVRSAYGIGQIIITPRDITVENLQPEDAPFAGILALSASFSSYDDHRLAALQLFAGCMGPCSGAESTQKFIHRWAGDPPDGWGNQLVDRWLGNVNYEYRHKVVVDEPEEYRPGVFAQDLSVGGMAALGNFARFAFGQVEYRFGWGLPPGFTKAPDPPGLGIMLDPVYADPLGPRPVVRPWRSYFTVVGRVGYIGHFEPAEGGETVEGGVHPGIDDIPGELQLLLGYHIGHVPFAFHVTYYDYLDGSDDIAGSSDWVNLSFEVRF